MRSSLPGTHSNWGAADVRFYRAGQQVRQNRRNEMKITLNTLSAVMGTILLGATFTATASAGCGAFPGNASASIRQDQKSRFVNAAYQPGVFMTVGYGDEAIVGLWQFSFTA